MSVRLRIGAIVAAAIVALIPALVASESASADGCTSDFSKKIYCDGGDTPSWQWDGIDDNECIPIPGFTWKGANGDIPDYSHVDGTVYYAGKLVKSPAAASTPKPAASTHKPSSTKPATTAPKPAAVAVVAVAPAQAPAAPSIAVDGHVVTVSWKAPTGGSAITGYTVTLGDLESDTLKATETEYEFEGVAAGDYTATVTATRATDKPLTSKPSDEVTVLPDASDVKGKVVISGDLTPGGTITVTGSGFAHDVAGFAVELHSEAVSLATVKTDRLGTFSVSTTIPATTKRGTHTIVVLVDGVTVAERSVTVTAGSAPFIGGISILGGLLLAGIAALLTNAIITRRRLGGDGNAS